MTKILKNKVFFCAHPLSFNEIKSLHWVFDLTGLVVKFSNTQFAKLCAFLGRLFISKNSIPLVHRLFSGGVLLLIFSMACCHEKNGIPLALFTHSADGVFFCAKLTLKQNKKHTSLKWFAEQGRRPQVLTTQLRLLVFILGLE